MGNRQRGEKEKKMEIESRTGEEKDRGKPGPNQSKAATSRNAAVFGRGRRLKAMRDFRAVWRGR